MAEKDTKFSAQGGSAEGWNVAVVGAGPAGLMVAGTAASLGLKVVLIEKNSSAGKKLLLTGNGRCNLANAGFSAQGGPAGGWNLRELTKNYNNGEFLFHAFSVFGPKETIAFFNQLGVETKIENNPSAGSGQANRVFPVSNDAKEILNVLKKYLTDNKVETLFNTEVTDVKKVGKKITKLVTTNGDIIAKNYIFTTGGKSYPLTGSTGSGYKLAEKLGHTIVNPLPALSPIRLSAQGGPAGGWKDLQGISLKDIKLTVLQNNKKILHRKENLFLPIMELEDQLF